LRTRSSRYGRREGLRYSTSRPEAQPDSDYFDIAMTS